MFIYFVLAFYFFLSLLPSCSPITNKLLSAVQAYLTWCTYKFTGNQVTPGRWRTNKKQSVVVSENGWLLITAYLAQILASLTAVGCEKAGYLCTVKPVFNVQRGNAVLIQEVVVS
jgi:hypothetical protein